MSLLVSILLFFSMAVWAEPPRKEKSARLGQEFTLKVGEQVVIKEAGLKITFRTVAEDSRCPKGVDCIWAGNGKIYVRVVHGKRKPIELGLNTGTEPMQQRFLEYDIKLVGLNPYPEKDVNINRGDYVATLMVSK